MSLLCLSPFGALTSRMETLSNTHGLGYIALKYWYFIMKSGKNKIFLIQRFFDSLYNLSSDWISLNPHGEWRLTASDGS